MLGPSQTPDSGDDVDARTERGSPPRMPRWVKALAIIVGALVLLFVVLQLTGLAGEHGPGRHQSEGARAPTGFVEVQLEGHMPHVGHRG